jgi:putative lysine transport system substrate-binding protein
MKMKRIVSLVLCFMMAAGVLAAGTACSKSTTTTTAKVLRVGMECAYAPFNWTQSDDSNGAVKIADSDNYANGYDVQMAKKIADSLGYDVTIVKTEWDGLIPALQSGKIDIIVAGMSITADRAQAVDFSDVYYDADIVVLTMKTSKYASATSLADLAGAKMTSQLSTVWYTLLDQAKGAEILPAMTDVPTLLVALTAGKIDAYTTDRPTAMAASVANPDVTIVNFAEGKGFTVSAEDTNMGCAVKKGNADLLKGVNEALAKISDSDRETIMKNAVTQQPLAN